MNKPFWRMSVTWHCNDTVWPLWLIGFEAWCCSWELICNFNGLLGGKTQANTQIRSHWMSSKRSACAPGLLLKSWLTVKSWTSAMLLCSTWSWWCKTLQIPAKSTHFYLPRLNTALNSMLLAFRLNTWLWCYRKNTERQIFKIFNLQIF